MSIDFSVHWSDNTSDLARNLALGVAQLDITQARVDKLATSLSGENIIRSANNFAAALQKIGGEAGALAGIEKLTTAEHDRATAAIDRAIDKYKALGVTAPQALQDIADALHKDTTAVSTWSSALDALGSSWVARIAEGILLRDAIHEVIGAVKEGIEFFPELVEHTIEVGNSLYEMSLKTGASVENLSALRYVASQTGIDFNSFGTILYKMEAALGATGAKADALQGHLNILHLNLKTLKDEKPDQAFIDIMSALEQLPNRADQAAVGVAIFGKGFKEMAGLTQESITELIDKAKDLGLVMSTETAAAAHAAEIGFKGLGLQIEAAENQLGAAFLPAIIGVEHVLSGIFSDAMKEANSELGQMGGGGGFLSTVAVAMGNTSGAIGAQTKLYEYLRDGMVDLVRGGIEPLVTATGFVMQEWNASKVVFGDVRQIIDGVRLAYLGAKQAMTLGLLPGTADLGAWRALDAQIADLEVAMVQRGAAIQKDKQAEDDWSKTSTAAVASIEAGLQRVSGANIDVGKIIKDLADISHKAFGGVGTDVQGSTKEIDKYAKEWQKNEDEIQKIWGEAFVAEQNIDKESLSSQLAVLEQKKQNEINAETEKIALSTKSVDQINMARWGINRKYDALEHDAELAALKKVEDDKALYSLGALEKLGAAERAASQKNFEAAAVIIGKEQFADQENQNIARQSYAATQAAIEKGALSTADYQILQVQRWQDDAEGKIDYTRDTWIAAYQAIVEEAKVKTAEIIKAQDPLSVAFQHTNDDMRNAWAATWDQGLTSFSAFGSAFEKTLEQSLADPFKKILAGMLADFESLLLSPLMDGLRQIEGAFYNYLVNAGLSAGGVSGGTVAGGGGGGIAGTGVNALESYGTKAAYSAIAAHFAAPATTWAATAPMAASFSGGVGLGETGAGVGLGSTVGGTGVVTGASTTAGIGIGETGATTGLAAASDTTAAAGGGLGASAGIAAGYGGVGIAGWELGQWLGDKTESKPAGAAMGAGAGAATGAAIGSIVPGLGTGIGAVVGGIAGAISGWLAAGHLYDEVKKQQADLMTQMGGMDAEIKNVGDAYALTGHTGEQAQAALHAMWDAKTPADFAKAVAPVADALQTLKQNTEDLQAATTDATGRISDAWKRVIALNTQYGSNTSQTLGFISQQATTIVSGFNDVVAAQVSAVAGYDNIKKSVVDATTAVDALHTSTLSTADIIAQMGPDEKQALLTGFASAQAQGFKGDIASFFQQQATLYQYAPESDPRLQTWLSGSTMTKVMAAQKPASASDAVSAVVAHMASPSSQMKGTEFTALEDSYVKALSDGFTGTINDFLLQQNQLYQVAQEGDTRLKTWLSSETVSELNAIPAVQAYNAALDDQQKAAAAAKGELEDLGAQAIGAYATSVAGGKSKIDAVSAESDALTTLEQEYQDLGLTVTDVGLKSLFTMNDMSKASGTLMQGVSGLTQEMVGLDNIGLESVATFAAQERTGEQMYTRLQAAADATAKANGDMSDQTAAALLPMQDYLHQVADEADKLHTPLDALTQQMIDQSKDAGIWQDEITPPETIVDVMGEIKDAVFNVGRALRGLPPLTHIEIEATTTTSTATSATTADQPDTNTTPPATAASASATAAADQPDTGTTTPPLEVAAHHALGGVVKPIYMVVGGPVGTDTVPAWLTPGEGVLTTAGMTALDAINNGHITVLFQPLQTAVYDAITKADVKTQTSAGQVGTWIQPSTSGTSASGSYSPGDPPPYLSQWPDFKGLAKDASDASKSIVYSLDAAKPDPLAIPVDYTFADAKPIPLNVQDNATPALTAILANTHIVGGSLKDISNDPVTVKDAASPVLSVIGSAAKSVGDNVSTASGQVVGFGNKTTSEFDRLPNDAVTVFSGHIASMTGGLGDVVTGAGKVSDATGNAADAAVTFGSTYVGQLAAVISGTVSTASSFGGIRTAVDVTTGSASGMASGFGSALDFVASRVAGSGDGFVALADLVGAQSLAAQLSLGGIVDTGLAGISAGLMANEVVWSDWATHALTLTNTLQNALTHITLPTGTSTQPSTSTPTSAPGSVINGPVLTPAPPLPPNGPIYGPQGRPPGGIGSPIGTGGGIWGDLPSFRDGSDGFMDFGSGQLAVLHGREAVVTESDIKPTSTMVSTSVTQKSGADTYNINLSITGIDGTSILRMVRSREFSDSLVNSVSQNKQGLRSGLRASLGVAK